MSLRWAERILVASSLWCGVTLAGCGDGDNPRLPDSGVGEDADAGELDAGGGGDQDADVSDSGSDEGGVKCGSNTCTGTVLQNTIIDPCCVPDDEGNETSTCGLDAADIKRANPNSVFTGCVPKDVPAASDSTYCGNFWDQVEPEGEKNGGLDIRSGTALLTFEGCCLPNGECGALISVPRGLESDVLNTHLGCVSFTRISEAFSAENGGTQLPTPAYLPYCNPSNGEPLMASDGPIKVPGVPAFVCGCGEDALDDGSGTFPCLNHEPSNVCGADAPTDAQLAMVPEFICGCGETTQDPGTGLPCMSFVAKDVCGDKAITNGSEELAQVPAVICGCGEAANTSEYGCLRNVEATVCGGELSRFPPITCGCGETEALDASERLCLPYKASTVCGTATIELDQDHNCLTNLPEYVMGCGSGSAPNCVPGAPAVYGCDPVISGTVRGVPSLICGCGDGVAAPNGLCLSNIPGSVCGRLNVPLAGLSSIDKSICGCGVDAAYDPATNVRPCVSHTAADQCGPADIPTTGGTCYTNYPAYLNGCGDGVTTGNCIYNGSQALFGCNQPAAGPVVPGVPKNVCGCGAGFFPNTDPPQCVPNVATDVCGTLDPDSSVLSKVPTFICGCGGANAARPSGVPASRPCLSYLPQSTCGMASPEFDAGYLAGLPSSICGCGASTPYDISFASPCLSNTVQSTCGGN